MAQRNKAMSSDGGDPDVAVLDVAMPEIIKPPDSQDVENGQVSSEDDNEETEEVDEMGHNKYRSQLN